MRDLPGLAAIEALGPRTWRARSGPGGAQVVVRVVRAEVGVRASTLLPVLTGLGTPHVVRLVDVVVDDVGWAVVEESAAGSLASWLGARSGRSAGEVVTLGVPIAEALAALHDEGLVHGSVGVDAVLLTSRGMPLLGRLWSAQELQPPPAPSREGDVRDLAVLCGQLLGGGPPHAGGAGRPRDVGWRDVPRALTEALTAALDDDPAERPDAAGLARALRRAAVATPLARPDARAQEPSLEPPARSQPEAPLGSALGSELGSAPVSREAHPAPTEPRSGRSAHRRVRRATAAVVALGCAAAIGAVSGARSARPSASTLPPVPPSEPARVPSTVSSTPPAAPPTALASEAGPRAAPVGTTGAAGHWQAVMEGLDARRAEAFATGEQASLDEVWAPGAAGLVADRTAVAALRERGWVTEGLRHRVTGVAVRSAGRQRAVLTVTDVLAAHRVVDASGRVVRVVGERGATSYDVVLVVVTGTWRLGSVTPAPAG